MKKTESVTYRTDKKVKSVLQQIAAEFGDAPPIAQPGSQAGMIFQRQQFADPRAAIERCNGAGKGLGDDQGRVISPDKEGHVCTTDVGHQGDAAFHPVKQLQLILGEVLAPVDRVDVIHS